PPRAAQADADAELAAGRAGQELAQGDEVRIGAVVEPAPALDELRPEVAEVGRGPAEGDEAELEEGEQDLQGGSLRNIVLGQRCVHGLPGCRLSRRAPGAAGRPGRRFAARCAPSPAARSRMTGRARPRGWHR